MKPKNQPFIYSVVRSMHHLGADGFTILEVLVASAIIAVSALGLGMAMRQMGQSRLKTQLVSQQVGLEASLVAAIQSADNYQKTGPNSQVLTEMIAGIAPTVQPTLNMTYDASGATTPIVAGGAPVYFDSKGLPLGPTAPSGTNWNVSVQLSPLGMIPSPTGSGSPHYAYNYAVKMNPALGIALLDLGSGTVAAPSQDTGAVPIPSGTLDVANQAKTTSCDPVNDLAMMGVDTNGNPICIARANGSCKVGQIAKGFRVVQKPGANPITFTYEFSCQNLASLVCPSQLMVGGVPSATIFTPYALQSFVPNTLDESGPASPTGTCVFVAAATSGVQSYGPYADGVTVANACPQYYSIVNPSCLPAATNDPLATPATVTCASSDPAAPVPPPTGPSGGVLTISGNTITCQRAVTKVCCGDNHSNCAVPWSGSVQVSYACQLDPIVSQTVPAVATP